MSKHHKVVKAGRQRGRDSLVREDCAPVHNINDGFTRHGPQHSAAPDWKRTCDRSAITRRSKRVTVTLPVMPWGASDE